MSSIENISPAVIKRISKELQDIELDPPEGIRVIVNYEDICDVQAWILGPESTPYENGCFRVKLVLGAEFPAVPPKCYFVTKIFHPNVSRGGDVCVNTLKKDWKKDLGIKHILLTVKCLLIAPNAESALNEEAGKLLLEDYDHYAKHARLLTDIHASNVASVFNKPNANNSIPTIITSTNITNTTMTTTSPSATPSTSSSKKIDDEPKAEIEAKSDEALAHTLMSPLVDSHHVNETKLLTNVKKNQLANIQPSPTVTPKKRVAEKKLDKKQNDKKRSLKRL
ncbi:hypothetical protein G9A89_022367 [Geosiphon pyriformis]|nr:hypothetical protein G9A89_022367 [Geosiphon pyriformis]